jgi:hypothetical protein
MGTSNFEDNLDALGRELRAWLRQLDPHELDRRLRAVLALDLSTLDLGKLDPETRAKLDALDKRLRAYRARKREEQLQAEKLQAEKLQAEQRQAEQREHWWRDLPLLLSAPLFSARAPSNAVPASLEDALEAYLRSRGEASVSLRGFHNWCAPQARRPGFQRELRRELWVARGLPVKKTGGPRRKG